MNVKLAKIMRKEAKKVLGGFRPTTYVCNASTGSIECSLTCTRGIYRRMKKAVRNKELTDIKIRREGVTVEDSNFSLTS